ncbi:MAG: hypothetical protein AVDCRST_MAG45-1677 [uncultured Solirubrobacterales bacterium]|uniref:Uncharacterized protein n=1 Tax=uncultured Solirubrobacterales bacterium TaxID=768556 RepID=A0A6J4SW94_9ACTN|nr:MAG: hypothetical protein AVDCRST_MAG45-1677 [uncultured Solirubrobacterales bacterium]
MQAPPARSEGRGDPPPADRPDQLASARSRALPAERRLDAGVLALQLGELTLDLRVRGDLCVRLVAVDLDDGVGGLARLALVGLLALTELLGADADHRRGLGGGLALLAALGRSRRGERVEAKRRLRRGWIDLRRRALRADRVGRDPERAGAADENDERREQRDAHYPASGDPEPQPLPESARSFRQPDTSLEQARRPAYASLAS